jgi:Arc/MetJ family transcription regulator
MKAYNSSTDSYIRVMNMGTRGATHRTTLELDLAELNRAKTTLGTKTTRETVNQALREVNRQADLRAAAALVRAGGLDIVRPEDLPDLRRGRA